MVDQYTGAYWSSVRFQPEAVAQGLGRAVPGYVADRTVFQPS